MTRRSALLHGTFRASIALKGVDGVLETIGGALLWFVKPSAMNSIVVRLCQHELSRDPDDVVARYVLHSAQRTSAADPTFASVYLAAHGILKIVVVTALWKNKPWAYPLTIGVFGIFIGYQVYRDAHTHSITLALLTVFDAMVIWLTWREWQQQRAVRRRAD